MTLESAADCAFGSAERLGDGAKRTPSRAPNADLVSFLLGKARTGLHGNTPIGPERPSRHQIGMGCCTSRQNGGEPGPEVFAESLSGNLRRCGKLRLRACETKRLRPLDSRRQQQLI